jgi:hypothetical protein
MTNVDLPWMPKSKKKYKRTKRKNGRWKNEENLN